MSIINNYCVKNPGLIEIEKILGKHVNIYKKKFELYHILCQWKLQFIDDATDVNSKRTYFTCGYWGQIRFSVTKIEYFSRCKRKFSHKSEMKIPYTTKPRYMTYEHYFKQPEPMIERVLDKKFYNIPELLKTFENALPPPFKNYKHNVLKEEKV